MDIILKSKKTKSLCDNCKYAQDCLVYATIGNRYNILSCTMDRPQDYTNIEIDPVIQKDNARSRNKLIKDFKTKTMDEKLDMIYERLINM